VKGTAAGALLACIVAVRCLAQDPGEQQGSRALTLDDFRRIRSLQEIRAAPDGKSVLLRIGTVDSAADRSTSDLWLLDLDSGALRQLTHHPERESGARFSPDGQTLAFIADRGPHARVFALPLSGGEARPLFHFEADIAEFTWCPDGKHLVFAAKDPQPDSAAVGSRSRPLVFTGTQFKADGEGYLDGRHSHLWLVDLPTGAVTRLTAEDYDDTEPEVSPDGRWIAFVSKRTANPDESYDTDVFVMPVAGGEITRVSRERGAATHPRWSPDGNSLAYVEPILPDDYGAISYIWVADLADASGSSPRFARPRNLTRTLDLSVGEGSYWEGGSPYPIWAPDGHALYAAFESRARLHGYAIDARTGQATLVSGGDRMTEYLTPAADGRRLVFGTTDSTRLTDVYVAAADGSGLRRLTHLNDDWFHDVRVSALQRFGYRSKDGTQVEGFVVKPLDYIAGRRYPTVLAIHGGPQWYYSMSYSTFFQLLAARGYLVVYTNPRGSTSYGQAFSSIVRGRYGQEDYADLMAGVDAAVARGWADPKNLFVTGYSYGGVMTNLIITRTTRFAAAASGGGVADFAAAFGVDDEHHDWMVQWGGPPWRVPLKYHSMSPINHVAGVRTPTLFFHGGRDQRCPVGESERMHLALRLEGVESKLAIFPDESHEFDHAASAYPERLRLIMDWFDAHRR
jgi:dipeptidyl aminopeptidase/acylaminoacyl peptidase